MPGAAVAEAHPFVDSGNQSTTNDDYQHMDCSIWREALSAMADGEVSDIDADLVTAHAAGCPGCSAFSASLDDPRMPARPAFEVPATASKAPRVVSTLNAAADRAAHWSIVRLLLAAVAVQVVVFAVPALLLGREGSVATHSARHLGAFGVAYGIALMVVVVRPARARSILPVAMVLAGAQVIGAVVDLATGTIPLVGEVRHLSQVLSVVLIWLLAVPVRRDRKRVGASAWPTLRIVDDDRRVG